MEELRPKKNPSTGMKNEVVENREEEAYPAVVKNLSEKWRQIRRREEGPGQTSFVERHYLALGISIGLLVIALLVVIGGFAFLVWNAH
jgi:hypothetical protein